MVRWGEYGEGGLLWAECKGKSCEWFSHEPVKELISKVSKRKSYSTFSIFQHQQMQA